MYSPLVHPSSFYSYLFIPLHLPLLCVIGMFSSTVFFLSSHHFTQSIQTDKQRVTKSISLSSHPLSSHISLEIRD